ncbi:MAG: hypothetical protein QGH94_19260 [Phycisphaerae bacterium]|jgi:hypothetical protein|nr:hypothetical protein [Phycisphaerae bacterium]
MKSVFANTALIKQACVWVVCGFVLTAGVSAHAATVNYTLDNVILDDGNTQMTGEFSWTYDDPEEFGDGEGAFSFLDIPFTSHDHTNLTGNFDVENSIEITFPGNVHDDGLDITLFLLQPLTPTTSAAVDLVRSKYEIGGNGFHDGLFLSGTIALVTDPPTPGDTDGDNDVDDTDYGNLIIQFGGPPGADSADFNDDGRVDLDDFIIMRGNFGFGVPPVAAVEFGATIPEPGVLSVVVRGAMGVLRRPRRSWKLW